MTIYQSPWARKYAKDQMTKEVREIREKAVAGVLTVIIAVALMTFIFYALIQCVDHEARIDERKRIAKELAEDNRQMDLFAAHMEQVSKKKK